MMTGLLILGGLLFLVGGAELLVRGASRLAVSIGISPLVVGLTVVAFGTSSPELAVSTHAAMTGEAEIALGNVVGSNIFNILFILGLSAMAAPLAVSMQLIRFDVPIMIGISILLALLGIDGKISRLDGLLLFSMILAYTLFLILQSRKENRRVQDEFEREYGMAKGQGTPRRWQVDLAQVGGGGVMLVLGSRLLVSGAVRLAESMGVSELMIGLTVIAAGTSLPELVTSVVATLRGEREIAVGNVVGSNIFNILAVIGVTGLVSSDGIPVSFEALRFDMPIMIMVALGCAPVFLTGLTMQRWEGALFVFYYLAYLGHLLLAAKQSSALPSLDGVVVSVALPLTAMLVLISQQASPPSSSEE